MEVFIFLSVFQSFSSTPDHDVVVYLNGVTPNEEVLGYFRNFLHRNLGIGKKSIHKTKHSLQFRFDDNLFDLLFAKNEVHTHSTGK